MPPGLMTQKEKKLEVLRHFHGLGYGLRDCSHRMRMARALSTLIDYAREAGLTFPDHPEILDELRRKKAVMAAVRAERSRKLV